MKTIGLIGGLSPQSTLKYYKEINTLTQELLGKHHSAKLILVSVDFEELVRCMFEERWDDAEQVMLQSCITLERCNVDYIALCCNTLHKVMDKVLSKTQVPFVHILDPIVEIIKKERYKRVGLLGSAYTSKYNFHKDYLSDRIPDVKIDIPNIAAREKINAIIFNELCHGKLTELSTEFFNSTVEAFVKDSVEAVILGCTELEMIFSKVNSPIPVLDTTSLHARFLVNCANCK